MIKMLGIVTENIVKRKLKKNMTEILDSGNVQRILNAVNSATFKQGFKAGWDMGYDEGFGMKDL
jgi:hypothetical protein